MLIEDAKDSAFNEKVDKVKSKLTFNQLYKVMSKKYPGVHVNRKDYQHVRSSKVVNIRPYPGAKSIIFDAVVQSQDGKKKYNVHVQFFGVDFSDKLEGVGWTKISLPNGSTYYFKKPSLFTNPCRVRCNCFDFQFRFAWEDRLVGALQGGPPKAYKRKTPIKGGRPQVNPDNVPGFCYHVWNVVKGLEQYITLLR